MWTSRTNGRQYGLLDRDEQARTHAVALVTGAGFGPAATETLVLRLVGRMATAPAGVRVAAAAEVTSRSDGVLQTIQEAMSQGAITYRDGQVVREPLGIGATVLTFGGVQRQMLPGPVGDLETARTCQRRRQRRCIHRKPCRAAQQRWSRLLHLGRGRRPRRAHCRSRASGR